MNTPILPHIISFDPRDGPDNGLTVDKAQELGETFCREQFPGHQAIVCTHPDGHNQSGNIHVHIVINSLRIENVPLLPYMDRPADTKAGCKHRCTDAAMDYFKSEVMELCHEADLYQIDLLNGSANRVTEREYWARKKGQAALDHENAALAAEGKPTKPTRFETDKEKLRQIIRKTMNDFYARDTSKKVSAVYRAKGNKGEHTGNHPIYGYLKDPENKQRWIIDEEAAAVVRRIFRMVIDGKGVYQIADILSEEKVLCPSAHLAAKDVGNRRNSKFEDPYRWWGTTVSYILARMEYMGHTVNFKTFKTCYRDKHRKQAPKEDWKILRIPTKPLLTRLHGKPRRSSAGRSGAVTAIKSRIR